MKEIIFVIGGCRSGKSRHALQLAEAMPGNRKIFIATCIPYDEEMRDRVRKHQAERSRDWKTLEVPIHIADAIRKHSMDADVILLDCLTLWMSNLMMENLSETQIEEHIQSLIDALKTSSCPVILVSNEVGCGIVPENALARLFRDMVGTVNQKVAECANRVVWTVAGIPTEIKRCG